MWNILSNICSSIINNIINPVPLFEWLVISDSICSSINFINNYLKYDLNGNKDKFIKVDISSSAKKDIYIKRYYIEIVKNYNSLYKIELFERYIFYLLLYLNYLFILTLINLDTIKYILYINFTIFTVPYVQNNLLEIKYINYIISEFKNDKVRFMKYSISKLTIKCIKELDVSIIDIKNYHIFILYNCISFEFLLEFIKCYILIYSLYFLRNSSSTYYYYKAIKIAYYYNTNYLFNIITKDEAIININTIIKEKNWKELSNIQNVHSLYTIVQHNFNQSDSKYDIYIKIIGFFTLWSFICFLKVINYFTSIICISVFVLINIYKDKIFLKEHYKKIFISYVVYFMIILGINDLVIALICANYKVLYYITNEIYFYIENKRDIKKVLNFYKFKQVS